VTTSTSTSTPAYFAVVYWGSMGQLRSRLKLRQYYRSLDRALRAARRVAETRVVTDVAIYGYATRAEAIRACISDEHREGYWLV
jgi:hypothetical protein